MRLFRHTSKYSLRQTFDLLTFALLELILFYEIVCSKIQAVTNLTIGYSLFTANRWNALQVTPITRMVGHITNCTFVKHQQGVILVENNLADRLLRSPSTVLTTAPLIVDYLVQYNDFHANTGPYVVRFGLSIGSEVQRLKVVYNRFLDNRLAHFRSTPEAFSTLFKNSHQLFWNIKVCK
ncbi:unnamed protein product [Protopolystoma xenopodis]|uniref:Uncharacterized protein n=1 Tax=Protopolystoma xenopodis TaxID=117903 RepID=A0A3S5FGD3_9PLAT|nr:unnamed protein product [Protopolystoma xenopodis]